MKSKIKKAKGVSSMELPRLLTDPKDGAVILAIEVYDDRNVVGTIVNRGTCTNPQVYVGYYGSFYTDEDSRFVKFDGVVKLKN